MEKPQSQNDRSAESKDFIECPTFERTADPAGNEFREALMASNSGRVILRRENSGTKQGFHHLLATALDQIRLMA